MVGGGGVGVFQDSVSFLAGWVLWGDKIEIPLFTAPGFGP